MFARRCFAQDVYNREAKPPGVCVDKQYVWRLTYINSDFI